MAKPNKKHGGADRPQDSTTRNKQTADQPTAPPQPLPKEIKVMAEEKPSEKSNQNTPTQPPPGVASGELSGKDKTEGIPVTEKPVPQKRELSRYVLSVDKAGGTVVKIEKMDDQTGKTEELSRDEYAAAFASAAYPSPLPRISLSGTEKKQEMNINSLSFNQGAADAAAALYGVVPDQFGGFSDMLGGYTDATGGYSDAFGGYSDATGGYYDAAGGYSDAFGGYSDTAGGYTDAYGGYSDAAGGYSDIYGGYADAFGGYSDAYGGYTDPAGGYTDAAGNYVDPASVAYVHGALSQMPY
jgi:hypothetical protein